MDDETKKWLFDIKAAIDSIYEYLGEKKDFDSFRTRKVVKRAVEREFEIIGEALNRILKVDDAIEENGTGEKNESHVKKNILLVQIKFSPVHMTFVPVQITFSPKSF